MRIETLASLAAEYGHTLNPSFSASSFVAVGGAHLGASGTAKEMLNWYPSGGSADADLLPDLDELRKRSRDITRNNGVAAGIIQTQHDNVVGTGPRLTAKPDYNSLGKDSDWAEEWSRKTEARWRAYAETCESDASWQLTFGALTGQVFRMALINGEALALPLWLPWKGSSFNTRFQVIEADRLCNPFDKPDSEKMRGGVEIDINGHPIAYHIRKTHPGDVFGFNFGAVGEWERIPAETHWGRARVLHVHDKERTGSNRGKPMLSPVLAQFKMGDTYIRTEMQAAAVNAFIAAFMETNLPPEHVAEMLGADPNDPKFQAYVANQSQYVAPLRGAAIIPTMPGTKITPFAPGRPAEQFGPFLETVFRQIGASCGLPWELLMKDFSKTNYSSARASLLEAYRFFLGRRKWLETFWCNRVYGLWLEEQVHGGFIEAPDLYDGTNLHWYSRCSWIWPGRGWIDPVKEIAAAEKRLVIGISTLERECAEQGEDWEEVQDQRAREKKRLEALGLPLLQQPNIGTPPGPQTPPPVDEETEDEEEAVAQ